MEPLWMTLLFIVSTFVQTSLSTGAGRAFPVESENFVIEQFKKVNPSLEWDPTNFLVDLSGQYANCAQPKGHVIADKRTPDGAAIDVFVDVTDGKNSDTNAVDGYIRVVIKRWVDSGLYNSQLRSAKRFGCSVRPACGGTAVIACVTTDDKGSNGRPDNIEASTKRPWVDETRNKTEKDDSNQDGKPRALAFTPEQYDLAEQIIGSSWDRSHFLEDLSGFETSCDMIGRNDWAFEAMKKSARERNVKITGQYGHSPNRGSTPDAMKIILSKFKQLSRVKQMGCSVIPDCKDGASMEVVISCLYEDA